MIEFVDHREKIDLWYEIEIIPWYDIERKSIWESTAQVRRCLEPVFQIRIGGIGGTMIGGTIYRNLDRVFYSWEMA